MPQRPAERPWLVLPQEAGVTLRRRYAADAGSLLLPGVGGLIDLVDGGTWTPWGTAPVMSAGVHGLCIDSTAAFGGLTLAPKRSLATAAQTHILLVETTAVSGDYAGLVTSANSDGSQASLAMQRDATAKWACWVSNGTFDPFDFANSPSLGPSVIILTGDASGTVAYVDGVLQASLPAPSVFSTSRLVLGGARDASASYATKARIWLYVQLTRRVSTDEIAEITAYLPSVLEPQLIWEPRAVTEAAGLWAGVDGSWSHGTAGGTRLFLTGAGGVAAKASAGAGDRRLALSGGSFTAI